MDGKKRKNSLLAKSRKSLTISHRHKVNLTKIKHTNYSMKPNNKPIDFSPRVAHLLSQAATLDTGTIALAAKELKAQQEKEAQAQALRILEAADNILKIKVAELQEIRRKEKIAKAELKKIDSAVAQFIKDGNVDNLKKAAGPCYYFGV